MGLFEDLLQGVPKEDRAILHKHPQLKSSFERLESDLAIVSRLAGEWVNWQNENWDGQAGMTRAEKALLNAPDTATTEAIAGQS